MILHCNGDPAEMAAVAEATPRLAGRSAERAEAALARRVAPADFDMARAAAEFAAVTAVAHA